MSMGDILLKRKEWTGKAWPGASRDSKMVLRVFGGLHYLKGNRSPYFGLTGELYVSGQWTSGGCMHETILEHFPEFADLAALHLSDLDGMPMHAAANGLYYLSGTFDDGLKQRYSYGISSDWKTPGKREKTTAECLRVAADHFRTTPEALEPLRRELRKWADSYLCGPKEGLRKRLESVMADYVESNRERFRTEARECIARHGLKVYGDGLPKEGVTPEEYERRKATGLTA